MGSIYAQGNIWSLKRCLDYAKETNITLQQAELNTQSSQIALTQSKAARMPNLNGNINGGNNFGYSVNPFTNQFQSQSIQSLNAGIGSNVTLFNGFRISNTIKQSQIDLNVNELNQKQAEYDLALNVTLAYLNILRNGEIVESAELQVNSTKEQLERTSKLVRAGSLAQADLIQLESQLATDELQLVNAQNQLAMSYLTLQQILRLDPNDAFGIEKPDLPDPELGLLKSSAYEIYQVAEATQPFIESADLNVKSAGLGIEIAKAGLRPSLTASANAGTGYASGRQIPVGTENKSVTTNVDVSINGGEVIPAEITTTQPSLIYDSYSFQDQMIDNIGGSVSLSLNFPIYNRSQNKSNIQRSELALQNAQLIAESQRQLLEQTIQQAYLDAKSAYSSYTSTMKQVEALKLTFENTEKQFNLGVANSTEYLLATNNLNRARNDLVRNKFNYIFRTKVLDFYQGKPLGL
ncbi:MAG: TolC family protein [Bacteroidia bacterium]